MSQPENSPPGTAIGVRKGLKLADMINIEEADDKSRLTITFRKLPENSSAKG